MSKYELIDDPFKDKWINKPNNMGDVGDLQDITDELNNLLQKLAEAREENAKLRDIAERAINYLDQSYRDGFADEASDLRYEIEQLKEKTK